MEEFRIYDREKKCLSDPVSVKGDGIVSFDGSFLLIERCFGNERYEWLLPGEEPKP